MKNLVLVAALAALAGCAVDEPGRYGSRYPQPSDPSQWRVVSVTPVPAGTGDQVAAKSPDGSRVEYSSQPISPAQQSMYLPQPVYVQQPVYVPQPLYVEPSFYYPPVSLSLGFVFGRHWSSGHGRGHYRGRHR